MLAMKKNFLINICLSLLSLIGSLAVGYSVYSYIVKKPNQSTFRSETGPYDYSFFNQNGRKLSDLDGMLKLVTDPFTIYKNYPNQKSSAYSIDKYGFREGYTSDKPSIAFVLGGSAAFGYALDNDHKTFASILSFSNERYNVINGSVIAFLSGQELSQMVHYLDDFNPKLYIVFDGWNDVSIPYEVVKGWPVINPLVGYNHAFLMIEDRLADYFQITRKEKNLPEVSMALMGELFDEKRFSDEIIKRYTANISKMHDFAHARGAEFLLIFQPELGNKKSLSENEKEALEIWNSKFGYLDKKISSRYKQFISGAKKIFQERNIPFIDINAEPEFSENPQTLFFDVVHPNELGHRVIANIIGHALSPGIQNIARSLAPSPASEEAEALPLPRCTLSFAAGWHAPEHNRAGWWRWTDGRGEMQVVTAEAGEVLLHGEIASLHTPNSVEVWVNDAKVATWQVSWQGFKAFEPVRLRLTQGANRLVLVSQNAAVRPPRDGRPLAVAVSNLRAAGAHDAAACELQL